jgi:hypothetical protein
MKNKYVVEVVITTSQPLLKKDIKRLIKELLEGNFYMDKVLVRSVDAD